MPLKDQESIGKAFTIETSQKTCHKNMFNSFRGRAMKWKCYTLTTSISFFISYISNNLNNLIIKGINHYQTN